jgi:membrane-associated protein
MTETLLALVPQWGAVLVAIANFLSCLAVPIPASMLMLAAGAFVASGDLGAPTIWTAAVVGAVIGDQAGFALGRFGGASVLKRLENRRRTGSLVKRAIGWLELRRSPAIFFSRWMFSALGPYMNLAAGGARISWPGFTLPAVLGECVWVSLYLGLGWQFSADVEALAETLSNLGVAVAAAIITLVLGRVLWRAARETRTARD